jgi:RNA-binding protein
MSENAENLPEIPQLTSAEKSEMRGLLQTLEPKVHVGKHGVTPTVLKEIEAAFKHEDLIKIKFTGDRKTVAVEIEAISQAARAVVVGSVGKVAGFYRPGAEVEAVEEEVEEVVEPKKSKKRKA